MLTPTKKPLFSSSLFFTRFAFILLVGLQSLLPHQTHALTRGEKGGTFLLASLVISANKNKLGKSALAQKIAKLTNTDSDDLVDASVLSTYYWAWSYLYESIGAMTAGGWSNWNPWAADLRYQATIQPLIQILATSKIYNKLFKTVPGLTALACTEKDCPGVCDECEYKHLARKAPLELGAVALHESSKKITHELEKIRIRRNHVVAVAAAEAANISALEFARQQAIRALDGHAGDIPGGQPGDGNCPVCLTAGLPLFSQLCPNLCGGSRLCQPCTQGIIDFAGGIAAAQCPACRGVGPALALPPAQPLIPALQLRWKEKVGDKLYYLALWEPFWTMCRKERNFLYRWGLEIRKINPLIARHISCKNRNCVSICHQCKLKKVFHIHDWSKELRSALTN